LEKSARRTTIVVGALVLSLGWTLGNIIYIDSIRASWLGWLEAHGSYDLLALSEHTQPHDILTARPFSFEVGSALVRHEAVTEIQRLRFIEAEFMGRTIVVEGVEIRPDGLPLVDGTWMNVASALSAGDGVLVSDNLARWARLSIGDVMALATPSGLTRFPIVGVFVDAFAGDLGSVLMPLQAYSVLWRDNQLSFIRIWLRSPGDVAAIRQELRGVYLEEYGVGFMKFRDNVRRLEEAFDAAFGGTYALLLVAFIVAFLGVANFLVTATLDRDPWYAVLRGVGFEPTMLLRVTLTEAVAIGFIGAGLGVFAGLVGGWIMLDFTIPLVSGWRFAYHVPVRPLVFSVAGAVGLAGLAGLLPGLRVARGRDVIGLRRVA
jgi:putative ABC transport system permease protein